LTRREGLPWKQEGTGGKWGKEESEEREDPERTIKTTIKPVLNPLKEIRWNRETG